MSKKYFRKDCSNCDSYYCMTDKVRRRKLFGEKYICKEYNMDLHYFTWICENNKIQGFNEYEDINIKYDKKEIDYFEKIDKVNNV